MILRIGREISLTCLLTCFSVFLGDSTTSASRRTRYRAPLMLTLWCLVLKMINTNEIQIEGASIHDAEEILELQKAAFLGQAQIYNNFRLPPLVQTIESIKLEFSSKTFLKAILGNQIIASVKFKSSGDVVHIDRLIVHPAFQNQGVGTYLMRSLEDSFPNGVVFQLFTGEKSSRNVHLYTKLGFQVIRKETTDQGIVLVHMEKHHNKGMQADAAEPRG